MNKIKKIISLVCISALLSTSVGVLNAQSEPYEDTGAAYESSRKAPSVSPVLVLGVVAAAALIAVCIQNRSHGHAH